MANLSDAVAAAEPRDDSMDFVTINGRQIYRGRGEHRMSDEKWAQLVKIEDEQKAMRGGPPDFDAEKPPLNAPEDPKVTGASRAIKESLRNEDIPARPDRLDAVFPKGEAREKLEAVRASERAAELSKLPKPEGEFVIGPGARKTIDKFYPPGSESRKRFDALPKDEKVKAWTDAENSLQAEVDSEKARIAEMPLAKEIPTEAPANVVKKRGINPQEDAEETDSEVRGGGSFKGLPVGNMVGSMTAGALPTDASGVPAPTEASDAGVGMSSPPVEGTPTVPVAEDVGTVGQLVGNAVGDVGTGLVTNPAIAAGYDAAKAMGATGTQKINPATTQLPARQARPVVAPPGAAAGAGIPEVPLPGIPQAKHTPFQQRTAEQDALQAEFSDEAVAKTEGLQKKIQEETDRVRDAALAETLKQQEMTKLQVGMRDRAVKAHEEFMSDYRQALDDAARRASQATDPDRFWNSRSTGQKVSAVIAGALFGFGGKGMEWLQHLDGLVDRDVKLQQADRSAAVAGLQAKAEGFKFSAKDALDTGEYRAGTIELQKAAAWKGIETMVSNLSRSVANAGVQMQAQGVINAAREKQIAYMDQGLANKNAEVAALNANETNNAHLRMQFVTAKYNADRADARVKAQIAAKAQNGTTKGQAATLRILGKFQSGLEIAKRVQTMVNARTAGKTRALDEFRKTDVGRGMQAVGVMDPDQEAALTAELTKAYQSAGWYAPIANMLKDIKSKTGLGLLKTQQSKLLIDNLVQDLDTDSKVIQDILSKGGSAADIPPEIAAKIDWKKFGDEGPAAPATESE